MGATSPRCSFSRSFCFVFFSVPTRYDNLAPAILKTLNGSAVPNMRKLLELVDSAKPGGRGGADDFFRFIFSDSRQVILEVAAARQAEAEILGANGISSRVSRDLGGGGCMPPGCCG